MKKKKSARTYSHLDPNKATTYSPLYYNGEIAAIGDLVKYHNLIDVTHKWGYDYHSDSEVFLLTNISEELVGTRDDTDDPMHAVEDYRWLADIRNNNNSHIVNLSYLVKVKGE